MDALVIGPPDKYNYHKVQVGNRFACRLSKGEALLCAAHYLLSGGEAYSWLKTAEEGMPDWQMEA